MFNQSRRDSFEFEKRGQYFTRMHNKTLSVIGVCVCNPDRSSEPDRAGPGRTHARDGPDRAGRV
jgi:hypothetical protein